MPRPSPCPIKTSFKDWVIPGPIPPGALGKGPELEDGESLDSISGHFRIFQLEKGHRFSTDDVLTAWYGTSWCPSARQVLDLGSGLGTVGLIASWRLSGSHVVAIEAQDESVRLARKSVLWNGLGDRFEIRHGDFREPDVLHSIERFDLVFGSPPYFPPGSGVEGDHPQKIACRFEMRGSISDYCAAGARHLAAGGFFACVFPIAPAEQEKRVVDAARQAGLALVRCRPVILRSGDRPLLGLFGMMRATDLPPAFRTGTWTEPPLTIRNADGSIHPEYSAVKLSFGFPP